MKMNVILTLGIDCPSKVLQHSRAFFWAAARALCGGTCFAKNKKKQTKGKFFLRLDLVIIIFMFFVNIVVYDPNITTDLNLLLVVYMTVKTFFSSAPCCPFTSFHITFLQYFF